MKDLCKFQVYMPINAKVTVQNFENLLTFILRQPCWWARELPQPIFPYNIIESSPTSFPLTLVSLVQTTSNLVQRHVLWSYRPYQNLGQIDNNLHNHVFDDVMCTEPPIVVKVAEHACDDASKRILKFSANSLHQYL